MMGFGMGFTSVWMIIFWIAVVGASIWVLATLFPKAGSSLSTQSDDDAFVILKKRYARGELSKEEYESNHHELKSI